MLIRFKTIKSDLLLVFFISPFLLSACAKCDTSDKKDVIAYVNKEPILKSELKRDMDLKARQDPTFKLTPDSEAEALDTIINRKLIVQKAMEQGLARKVKFVNTIKAYWEQTLIRDFLEYKQKGFADYLFVTEDEIKNYYDKLPNKDTLETMDKLRPEIEKRIKIEKESALFEDWLKSEKKKANIRILLKSLGAIYI